MRNHPVTRDEVYMNNNILRDTLWSARTGEHVRGYGPAIVAVPLDACLPTKDDRKRDKYDMLEWDAYNRKWEYAPHEPIVALFDPAWPLLFKAYYPVDKALNPRYCARCGRAFATYRVWSRTRYCSNRCAVAARDKMTVVRAVAKRSALRAKARANRNCEHCRRPIEGQRSTRKYCSERCRVAHHRAQKVLD